MQFIKNKTTNQSKLLLTSSILILNGNMCGLVNSKPKPGQQPLKQSTTNSSPILATQAHSEIEGIKGILSYIDDATSKLKKAKQELSKYNLSPHEEDNKGHDGGNESGYESDAESEPEPIYEEINYGKIDQYKNKNQEYNHSYIHSTREHYDQGYSSGSDTAHHTDGADDGQKTGNGNDTNGHIYEAIPPIMADESTNGKQSNEPPYQENAYHQIYSSYNDTEDPIYEDPEDLKDDDQSRTSSNTYDSVYEPNNETTNEFITTREAIKPIQIMKYLKTSPDEVHEEIPAIKKFNLIETVIQIEKTINEMVAMRRDDDHLLTEAQKKELATLKTKIKAADSACNDVINLYNNPPIIKKNDKIYYKQAKDIAKKIKRVLEDTQKLRSSIKVTDL